MALTGARTNEIFLQAAAPGTYGPYVLNGGLFAIVTVWGASATIALNVLGPDGSTQIPVATLANTTTFQNVYLPTGTYQVVIGTAASSISVREIPLN
jgi:hypothetical protein